MNFEKYYFYIHMDVKLSPHPILLPQTRYPEREKIARRIQIGA